MSRPVSVTRDAPGNYTITVGETVLALNAVELMHIIHQCMNLQPEPDQYERLRTALAISSWEVDDILKNQPFLKRALSLTLDDLKLLADLTIRVSSPWE